MKLQILIIKLPGKLKICEANRAHFIQQHWAETG